MKLTLWNGLALLAITIQQEKLELLECAVCLNYPIAQADGEFIKIVK